ALARQRARLDAIVAENERLKLMATEKHSHLEQSPARPKIIGRSSYPSPLRSPIEPRTALRSPAQTRSYMSPERSLSHPRVAYAVA
ncbi:unnamed protein product, partial [Polarella glacialis]